VWIALATVTPVLAATFILGNLFISTVVGELLFAWYLSFGRNTETILYFLWCFKFSR
jgi:hypothetical protein